MRHAILLTAIDGKGVAEKKAHCLSPTCNRNMQHRVVVRTQFSDDRGDFVRRADIVLRCSDVRQWSAVGTGNHLNVVGCESNFSFQVVLFTECIELPVHRVQQVADSSIFTV